VKETEGSLLLAASNNSLDMVFPVPNVSVENEWAQPSRNYAALLISLRKTRVARNDETINIQGRLISTDEKDYEALVNSGRIEGLLLLATQISLNESRPAYEQHLFSHSKNIDSPANFAASTKQTVHKRTLMSEIGRIVGSWCWEVYAQALTKQLSMPIDDDFLFYIFQANKGDTNYPNTQYVGLYKDKCMIVCEELQYTHDDIEAVPRYAVIPASTFDFDLAKGLGTARQFGLAFLSSPGISSYMRMRPSLSGPPGVAAGGAMREALENAKALYERDR
jgi:hypothetical protein